MRQTALPQSTFQNSTVWKWIKLPCSSQFCLLSLFSSDFVTVSQPLLCSFNGYNEVEYLKQSQVQTIITSLPSKCHIFAKPNEVPPKESKLFSQFQGAKCVWEKKNCELLKYEIKQSTTPICVRCFSSFILFFVRIVIHSNLRNPQGFDVRGKRCSASVHVLWTSLPIPLLAMHSWVKRKMQKKINCFPPILWPQVLLFCFHSIPLKHIYVYSLRVVLVSNNDVFCAFYQIFTFNCFHLRFFVQLSQVVFTSTQFALGNNNIYDYNKWIKWKLRYSTWNISARSFARQNETLIAFAVFYICFA